MDFFTSVLGTQSTGTSSGALASVALLHTFTHALPKGLLPPDQQTAENTFYLLHNK